MNELVNLGMKRGRRVGATESSTDRPPGGGGQILDRPVKLSSYCQQFPAQSHAHRLRVVAIDRDGNASGDEATDWMVGDTPIEPGQNV